MSGRPTPETDDLARGNHVVPTEWAEQLEIERNEAIRQRDCLHELHNKNAIHSKELLELCGTLRKERDEARKESEYWQELYRTVSVY